MSLLPFDPLSPRALSIMLLGLIVLVTFADKPGQTSSLVSNNARYVNCYGADASNSFRCPNGSRNRIAGGNLMVGSSF